MFLLDFMERKVTLSMVPKFDRLRIPQTAYSSPSPVEKRGNTSLGGWFFPGDRPKLAIERPWYTQPGR